MPKSLTSTSEQIAISFESVAAGGSYISKRIDLQLNPLDREVFVVSAVKLDLNIVEKFPLNLFGGGNTNKCYGGIAAITKAERSTAISNLGDNSCFATTQAGVGTAEDSQPGGDYAVAYSFIENSSDTPTSLEYVDIIATDNFFVGLQNQGDSNLKVTGKVYGYRARASADVYAALVQSEVLSS